MTRRSARTDETATALDVSIGLLVRRLRQLQVGGELTMPETSALARLDRGGPATSAALARMEQISPQSMGATLGALEARGMVERRPDPTDGRRILLSPTESGLRALRDRRRARARALADAMSGAFTDDEVDQLRAVAPLIERLAHSI
jgi:DNA-binding MarR family transcriptional regulator